MQCHDQKRNNKISLKNKVRKAMNTYHNKKLFLDFIFLAFNFFQHCKIIINLFTVIRFQQRFGNLNLQYLVFSRS
jgi:hypothetical protein